VNRQGGRLCVDAREKDFTGKSASMLSLADDLYTVHKNMIHASRFGVYARFIPGKIIPHVRRFPTHGGGIEDDQISMIVGLELTATL
jgi:hypothetical protein